MIIRPLTSEEWRLIACFASRLHDTERAKLLDDLGSASATSGTPDGSRVVFHIAGYERPRYQGQHPFGVEGRMLDSDGAELSVLLHADENGRLLELEFIRWDSCDLLGPVGTHSCCSPIALQQGNSHRACWRVSASAEDDVLLHIFGPENLYVEYTCPGGWRVGQSNAPW